MSGREGAVRCSTADGGLGATADLVLRRAERADVDVLAGICRESFSGSLLWNGPRFLARDWWRAVIDSASAETWVYMQQGTVGGFCILVTDRQRWKAEPLPSERNRHIRMLAAAMCPRLLFSKLVRMVRPARDQRPECQGHQGTTALSDESTAWIRLLAVSPSYRRLGIAKKMLQFCERRTREIQRKGMQLFVFSEHQSARRLYLRQGFLCTEHRHNGCVMMKVLESAATA